MAWSVKGNIQGPPGPVGPLNNLSDVNAPSPSNDDALRWDSATSKWISKAVSGGGGASGNIPIYIKSANYTFVAGDAGHNVAKSNTNGYTFTLNNSVFSAGDWLMVSNFGSSGNITIARGPGVTLYYTGSTMNSDKIVIPQGMAMIYMESASVGRISGIGVG
ncbi:MAG: hypothetical protein IAE88_10485 [Rhodobacteraceae bacterium]|nr:hypothetical protein [Paracoccaceae bacterium]